MSLDAIKKLNGDYSKEISAYTAHRAFYNEQAEKVIAFCKERNIQFHIKDGTIRKLKETT